MANDFSLDSRIIAVYNFASGSIGVDRKGSNDLTATGTVPVNTTFFKQGDSSAQFDLSGEPNVLSLSNADQPSNWPYKSSASDQCTIMHWIYFKTLTGAVDVLWRTNRVVVKWLDAKIYPGMHKVDAALAHQMSPSQQ